MEVDFGLMDNAEIMIRGEDNKAFHHHCGKTDFFRRVIWSKLMDFHPAGTDED